MKELNEALMDRTTASQNRKSKRTSLVTTMELPLTIPMKQSKSMP